MATQAAEAVTAIRALTPGLRVSVSTRDGIVDSARTKLAHVADWPIPDLGGPDCASVNWHEGGALEIATTLRDNGIGVEAGIWTPRATIAFVSTNWPWQVERVLEADRTAGLKAVAIVPAQHVGDVRRKTVVRRLSGDLFVGESGQPLMHGVDALENKPAVGRDLHRIETLSDVIPIRLIARLRRCEIALRGVQPVAAPPQILWNIESLHLE